jgi:Cof subfamily protein (haloacid dehalogenase superfamily)
MAEVRRRVYVTDLDGTLLGEDARLSSRTRSGLSELLDDGLVLTVASARSVVAMQSILSGLRLPLPVVEFNGAFISDLDTGRHLVTNALDPNVAGGAYELIHSAGSLPFVSAFDGASDRLYYSEIRNPGMAWYVNDRLASGDRRVRRIEDQSSRLNEEVVCLTAIDEPGVVTKLGEDLVGRFGEAVSVRAFENQYFPGWDWLTVHDANATKDRALATLVEVCGLDGGEVVAFGDSDNDIPMFRFADRAIAVGNGSEELKSLADEVIGSNSEDGVVEFLEREWRAESSREPRRPAARLGAPAIDRRRRGTG